MKSKPDAFFSNKSHEENEVQIKMHIDVMLADVIKAINEEQFNLGYQVVQTNLLCLNKAVVGN